MGVSMDDVKRKMELYQSLAQSLQAIMMQRQALAVEKLEMEKALAELERYEKDIVYKSIGVALIEAKKEEVVESLKERMEEVELKLESLKKQEEIVRKRLEKLKKELKEAGL